MCGAKHPTNPPIRTTPLDSVVITDTPHVWVETVYKSEHGGYLIIRHERLSDSEIGVYLK